jgi:hypothetical protein
MNLTKLLGVVILGGLAFAHKKDWVLRWIALTVIANGILCHGISTPTLVNWDIFCNILLALYINSTTCWQPQCMIVSLWSFCAFLTVHDRTSLWAFLVHVMLVQAPMMFVLTKSRDACAAPFDTVDTPFLTR